MPLFDIEWKNKKPKGLKQIRIEQVLSHGRKMNRAVIIRLHDIWLIWILATMSPYIHVLTIDNHTSLNKSCKMRRTLVSSSLQRACSSKWGWHWGGGLVSTSEANNEEDSEADAALANLRHLRCAISHYLLVGIMIEKTKVACRSAKLRKNLRQPFGDDREFFF